MCVFIIFYVRATWLVHKTGSFCVHLLGSVTAVMKTSWPSVYPRSVDDNHADVPRNLSGTAKLASVGLHLPNTSNVDWLEIGTVHIAFAFTCTRLHVNSKK
jgi:hypothetical protein